MKWARVMLPVTTLCISACGVLLGIDTDLSAPADDAGIDVIEASTVPIEASTDSAVDVDAGSFTAHRPAEGVYLYTVIQGHESLDDHVPFNDNADYTTPVTATVVHEAGSDTCFTMTIELRKSYDETIHLCVSGPYVVADTIFRLQSFPPGPRSMSITCAPPVVFDDTTTTSTQGQSCAGTNKDGADPFVTKRTLDYDGTLVTTKLESGAVVNVRTFTETTTFSKVAGSNAATGTITNHWSFSKADGTLVILSRHAELHFVGGLGSEYTEDTNIFLKGRIDLDAGADADSD